jgi:adenylosuccinate synthase
VEGRFKRYGSFEYDTEGEIQRYKVIPAHVRIHDRPEHLRRLSRNV